MNVLREKFYGRSTIKVAKELLGKYLVHEVKGKIIVGKIVETESYVGVTDKAAHVYGGKTTARVMPLYGKEGTAYIYQIYGKYLCLNAITEREGEPQGVLIRALEPVIGLEFMANERFGKQYDELTRREKINLTSGPSKLCIALNITKELNNTMLFDGEMYIVEKDKSLEKQFEVKEEEITNKIIETTRIGIDYAEEARDYPYRYYLEGNSYVSKK